LSFAIAGASACASPSYSTAAVSTTDPTYLAAPGYVPGQTFFTTDPAYFAAERYVADQTFFTTDPAYFASPTYVTYPIYVAIGGFHRHRHACGHRASHAHRR
jgi:hypothetical protein